MKTIMVLTLMIHNYTPVIDRCLEMYREMLYALIPYKKLQRKLT